MMNFYIRIKIRVFISVIFANLFIFKLYPNSYWNNILFLILFCLNIFDTTFSTIY